MASRIWLHIGTEKTGTTTIQSFLAANRPALAARGFVVPVSPGRQNHLALTGYAQADDRIDDVRIGHGVRTPAEVAPYRARVEQELYGELAEVTGQVVLSNEHMSSRLRTRPEIARLKVLLDRIAPKVTVVVYLRNQVDFLASWYSTSVKAGSVHPLARPLPRSVREMMDYAKLLADWGSVFGRDAIVPRRFVPADFVGGDLLCDFADAIGLDATGLAPAARRNESLDEECVIFLRAFNRHVPRIIDGRLNPLRHTIVAAMESISSGPPCALPPDLAAQVEQDYTAANAEILASHFPSRPAPLFPPPRAIAEGAPSDPAGNPASFARIAAALWTANVTRIRALEQESRDPRQARRDV